MILLLTLNMELPAGGRPPNVLCKYFPLRPVSRG